MKQKLSTEDRVVLWNNERNITSQADDKLVVTCLLEEMFEFLGINKAMNKDQFKKLVHQYASHIRGEAEAYGAIATIEEKIDALCDTNVFSNGFIYRYGYNPNIAMDECLKEIESRTGSIGEDGKWIKSDATYTADYSEAKL